MDNIMEYKELEPPKKWFKTQVVRLCIYFLGKAMETAYKNVPEVKKEMDALNRVLIKFVSCK